jgi:hypothetical protein
MAGYWPTADQDPGASAPVIEFSRIWRDMPKVLFSRTLEQAGWNTTIVRELVPEEIQKPGGDLVVGGADLAAASCSARRTGSISGAPRLIQPAIGYECMKCVENAVPPGKNPPVEIWTVRLLFTRWNI